MRLSRIHTTADLKSVRQIDLPKEASNYIAKVLRLRDGDFVRVFNSKDGEFSAQLTSVTKQSVQINIGEKIEKTVESPLNVHLGLGLSRGERMDFAIQKATELGVSAITPLFTERSEVRLNDDRAAKKQLHWQKIAISACEQSGRIQIPEVNLPAHIDAWLQRQTHASKLIFDGSGGVLEPTSSDTKPVAISLAIGPEGGFSEAELQCAIDAGYSGVKLGPRILRTETAPIAALAVLQYLYGDF